MSRADPQQSLRQASAALDSAFRRIRQIRHTLLELSERLPASSPRSNYRNASTTMNPGHESISLTGSPARVAATISSEDMERLRATLPRSVLDQIAPEDLDRSLRGLDPISEEAFSRSRLSTRLPPASSSSSIWPGNTPQSPISPTTLSPRLPANYLYHSTDVNPDDASTALGRRVAARVANSSGSNSERRTIPQLERVLLQTTAEIARNLRELNSQINATSPASRSSEVEATPPVNSLQVDLGQRSRGTDEHSDGAGNLVSSPATTPLSATGPSFPSRIGNRRWRPMRVETTTSTWSRSSGLSSVRQLSTLSNFSGMENLSSPVVRDNPVLFEEPDSYTSPPQSQPPAPAPRLLELQPAEGPVTEAPVRTVESTTSSGQPTSYQVLRRIGSDGQETVYNIRMDWTRNAESNDPAAWLLPRPARRPRRVITPATVVSQPRRAHYPPAETTSAPPQEPRRRRGWARIDPDGDEIPSEEEEEIERLRSRQRMRLAHTEAERGRYLIPTTGASMEVDYDGVPAARVRLNQLNALDSVLIIDRARRPDHNSTGEQTGETCASSQQWYGSTSPFVVNILPMPLEAMESFPKRRNRKRTCVGGLPKDADWAGR